MKLGVKRIFLTKFHKFLKILSILNKIQNEFSRPFPSLNFYSKLILNMGKSQ
jgi:hypothetical protein